MEALIPLLSDRDEWVRQTLATALGRLGSRQAIEGLLKLFCDKEKSVREAAATELNKLAPAELIAAFASDAGVDPKSAESLLLREYRGLREPGDPRFEPKQTANQLLHDFPLVIRRDFPELCSEIGSAPLLPSHLRDVWCSVFNQLSDLKPSKAAKSGQFAGRLGYR